MSYGIFTDKGNDEFSTTKFSSITGTLVSAVVVCRAAFVGMDGALLTQILIYLAGMVGGMAIVRRIGGGKPKPTSLG